MLWGCFAANGSGAPKRVNGIMKKEDYLPILQEKPKLISRRLGLRWLGRLGKVVKEWLNQAAIEFWLEPHWEHVDYAEETSPFQETNTFGWTSPILSRRVENVARGLSEVCGWLSKVSYWDENSQENAWMFVFVFHSFHHKKKKNHWNWKLPW